RLTPIGKVFLPYMQQALRVIENGTQVIQEYTDPDSGTIKVGFPSSLATYVLPTAISAFWDQSPNVKFELHQGSYHYLKESVNQGDINMAILGTVPLNEKKMNGTILFTEKIVALLPLKHPLAKATSLQLTELQNEDFVMFQKGFVLRDVVSDACMRLGFQPNISFEGEDIDSIKGLVSGGLGISLVQEITLIDNV